MRRRMNGAAATIEARAYGSESQVVSALRDLFPLPSYALLPGVGDATGLGKVRTADALVMSCWPSRGLDLIGVEVKVSRGDWLRELKDPAKAESVCRFCDRWYVAAGEAGLVRDGELPATWGLIEPKGDRLAIKVQAPKLDPVPMSKPFLASILRTAAVVERGRWNADIEAARHKGYQEGQEQTKRQWEREVSRLKEELARLHRQAGEFTEATGIAFHAFSGGLEVGKAVNFVLGGGLERLPRQVDEAERLAADITRTVESYRAAIAAHTEGEESEHA